jgi:hypothetical protein
MDADDSPAPMPLDEVRTLLDEFDAALRARRDAELRCARVLEQLGRDRSWELLGCASIGELGERHGVAATETRALFDLGRAIRTTPLLESQVAQGKVTVAAASCVSEVLADPALLRREDDWIGWAQTETTRKLRDRVRRRREEVRIGDEPACPLTVYVRLKARDDFQRARAIASRRAGRTLTHGETFETLLDHYLTSFDEDRVKPGERRCPPTSLVEGRYVPMAVRREIFERQGRECAVPFCNHTMFLEMAHLWAHASGGDREADNLVLLCSRHHGFLDSGRITLVGTAASPRFYDGEGRDMSQRYDPGGSPSDSESLSSRQRPNTPSPNSRSPVRSADPPSLRPSTGSGAGADSEPTIETDRRGAPPDSTTAT